MVYGEWNIGGIIPNWKITADYSQISQRKLTLTCLALRNSDNDPRVEIDNFISKMMVEDFSNTPLLYGGSCLQTLGGEKVQLTDGVMTWTAALVEVGFVEENYADQAIEFNLLFEVETQRHGGGVLYMPHYGEYTNTEYSSTYCNGIRGDLEPGHGALGNEVGYLMITEPRDVKRVELFGNGCETPADISVNGVTQTWHYYHDIGPQGTEKLIFNLNPVTNVILITATHEDTCPNHGAWLHWVRVMYV